MQETLKKTNAPGFKFPQISAAAAAIGTTPHLLTLALRGRDIRYADIPKRIAAMDAYCGYVAELSARVTAHLTAKKEALLALVAASSGGPPAAQPSADARGCPNP